MDDSLSDYERRLIAHVEQYGWQCTMVGDPDGVEPPFAYTAGLWHSLGSPELIVFGLDFDLMHDMLSDVVRRIASGATLSDGARWKDVLEGVECVTRAVHSAQVLQEWFASALWYRSHASGDTWLEAYQLVWPGAYEKLFPWDEGCSADVIDAQPPLWLPPAENDP